TMLREARLDAIGRAAPPESLRSRRLTRAFAVTALITLGLAATWLAVTVAAEIGSSVFRIPGLDWLAGQLDKLADWWESLGLAGQLLVIVLIAALIVLSGGTLGLAMTMAGGFGFLAAHGRGAADFVRNPRKATTDFVTNLTPQQAAAYALEIALGRIIPAGVGGLGGRKIRRWIDDRRGGGPPRVHSWADASDFERTIDTPRGPVDVVATVTRSGDRAVLDVATYGRDGDLVGAVGPAGWRSVGADLLREAAPSGIREVTFRGVRAADSTGLVGHEVTMTAFFDAAGQVAWRLGP
ncbi:MAG: hypothetical protein LC808_07640, partial [Actinobacteria bacterium]|nr:hypothetical protein [Actinomycetota bacterium]